MPENELSSHEERVNEAIAAYIEAIEHGETPDTEKFLADHADVAQELKSYIANQAQFREDAGVSLESHLQAAPVTNAPAEAATPTPPEGGTPTDPSEPTLAFQQRGVPSRKEVLRYFGEYELLEEIARGGMGVVYRARQVRLNRIVAVKMILSGQLASPEDVDRFHTEAEAAAKLDHPGIVPIYEVGQHEGQHYFSMGFVEGQSLSERIAEGPLPAREAAELVKTVSDALQYAHDNGVIHRDLKPGNILLDRQGHPRVTDFGLAKLAESGSDLTGTGQILGTPSYMPPEQAAAKVSAVGRLSDIYSLGAILYCLLTGRPPFHAANPFETLLQVQKQEPVPPRQLNPAIPLDLDTIVLKCLDKSPSRRYSSASALAEELNRYLEGRPILARRVSRAERFWRWCRREPMIASLSAAVIVALVAASLAWIDRTRKLAEHAETLRRLEVTQNEQIASSFTTALETFEDLCRPLANGEMHNLAVFRPIADRIDRFTSGYLEKFEETPSMAVHTGRVYELRATVSRVLSSDTSQALRYYQKAEEIYRGVKPDDEAKAIEFDRRVAHVHLSLGRLLILRQEFGLAEDMLAQTREALEKQSGERPDDRGLRRDLAEVYHSLGEVFLERTGDVGTRNQALVDSRTHFERSRDLRQVLMGSARGSERADYERDLARSLGYLGDLCRAQGKVAEAVDNYNRSLEHRQKLYNLNPTDPENRFQLARGLREFGYFEWEYRGKLGNAIEKFGAAQLIQAKLADDFPEVAAFRRDYGTTLNALAEVSLLEAIRNPEKRAEYTKLADEKAHLAGEIYGDIIRRSDNQADAEGVHGLARSYVMLALLEQLNHGKETVRFASDAERLLLERLGGEQMLGRSQLVTLAMCRSLQGQPEEAFQKLKYAVERGEITVNRFECHRSAAFRAIAEHPQLGPQFDDLCRALRSKLSFE